MCIRDRLEKRHLEQLIREHGGNAATVMTTELADPSGYGRIIRDSGGSVIKLVEESDASADEKEIREVNSGTYCFDIKYLRNFLPRLSSDNVQREYYLPDILTPVSYTHLDVYKRQPSGWEAISPGLRPSI